MFIGDTHKNSIHLQGKCYDEIDKLCGDLMASWQAKYPGEISNKPDSCVKSSIVIDENKNYSFQQEKLRSPQKEDNEDMN